MQPSSGTMTEVRQCGIVSPRESGRLGRVAPIGKNFESPGLVFFSVVF